MKKNTRNGLVALGLAAWAYWKYKMTPEDKQNLKNQVSDAGKKLMDKVPQDLKSKAESLTQKISNKAADATNG